MKNQLANDLYGSDLVNVIAQINRLKTMDVYFIE